MKGTRGCPRPVRVPMVWVTPIARAGEGSFFYCQAQRSLQLETSERRNYVQDGLGRRIRIEDRVLGGKHRVPPAAGGVGGTGGLYGILTEMGYGAPREGNAHRPRLADGGAPAFTWRGWHVFTDNTLGLHSSGARRLAAYHDDRRRPTVTEIVLAVNARYRGPEGKRSPDESRTSIARQRRIIR